MISSRSVTLLFNDDTWAAELWLVYLINSTLTQAIYKID